MRIKKRQIRNNDEEDKKEESSISDIACVRIRE